MRARIVLVLAAAALSAAAPPPAKLDHFGDPLPVGAAMRLGTVRFRAPGLSAVGFNDKGDLVGLSSRLGVVAWTADGRREPVSAMLQLVGRRQTMSPDGRFVAGHTHSPHEVAVSDLSGGKPVALTASPAYFPYHLAFSAKGQWLAVNDSGFEATDPNLQLCHLPTRRWYPVSLGIGSFRAVAFSPDETTLAVLTSREITLLDAATRKVVRRLPAGRGVPDRAAFSPDGKTIATAVRVGASSSVVRVTDLATGRPVRSFDIPPFAGIQVAFSPDGRSLWAGGPDGRLVECDPATGKVVRQIAAPASRPVVFSADGKRMAAHGDDAVVVWDNVGRKVVRADLVEGGHTSAVRRVAVSPDGKVIASTDATGLTRTWDASTGRPLGVARDAYVSRGPAVAFLADSKAFVAIDRDRVTPVVFDATTGKEVRRFAVSGKAAVSNLPGEPRLSADGRTLTTYVRFGAPDDKSYAVRWDVASGKEIGRPELPRDWSSKTYIADRSPDQTWEVYRGQIRRVGADKWLDVVPGFGLYPGQVEFTADGRLAAIPYTAQVAGVLGRSQFTRVYDLRDGKTLSDLPTGRFDGIAFSPSGKRLALLGPDGPALWDIATGRKVWTATAAPDRTADADPIAFAPDGRRLVTGHGTAVVVWDLPKE